MADDLPECGLYRTGIALPGRERQVPVGRLVKFHNHSTQGPPLLLLPESNSHNKWRFRTRGYLVESPTFIEALVPLKPEGYYVLREHAHITQEEILPERTLVQLGYNNMGQPILFVGRFEANHIAFPERGYRFKRDDILSNLEPAGFRVPDPPRVLH